MHQAQNTIMPAIFGLLAFFALFAGAIWLLRWLQKRTGNPIGGAMGQGQVRVLIRYPLAWQCMLMVVEVAGQQYVITTSRTGGVTVLDKCEEALPEANAGAGGFTSRLRQAIDRRQRNS